jgi:small ligand-binding sensory domain FIST
MERLNPFHAAHAASPDWLQAANSCLVQLDNISPGANFGFLYVTDGLTEHLARILAYFKEQTDIEDWVGTVGVGICASGQEYHDEPAMCVMLAEFPAGSFRVFPSIRAGLGEFSRENRDWCAQAAAHFAIVHGDPRNLKTPVLIEQLSETLGGGFLVGGLSSARGAHVQIAGKLTEGGVSGVLFSDAIAVTTALTQGCTPLGAKHTITECQDNIAIKLDGRPALTVFQEEIGELLARDPARIAGYIMAGFPIKGSDTGDYLVRNILGVDTRHQLIAIGEPLGTGDMLQFCRRDDRSAYEDLLRMLRDIRARSPRPPRGGVYYSCLGRGNHMFGPNSEELKTIRQELGEFPLVGFFASGEISHSRLYGFTGVLTLFH